MEEYSLKEKVDRIIELYDTDKDGKLDFGEFPMNVRVGRGHNVEGMYAAYQFEIMDKNKDGFIEPKEIDRKYE